MTTFVLIALGIVVVRELARRRRVQRLRDVIGFTEAGSVMYRGLETGRVGSGPSGNYRRQTA